MTSQSAESRATLDLARADSCDRRAFLAYAGSAAGALMACGVAPLAVAGTSESFNTAPAMSRVGAFDVDPGESWHIDDMWGHSPRYAHPIPHICTQHLPLRLESAEPVDWQWVG